MGVICPFSNDSILSLLLTQTGYAAEKDNLHTPIVCLWL